MDGRWTHSRATWNTANRIRDMVYDERDGWRNSGGWGPVAPKLTLGGDDNITAHGTTITPGNPYSQFFYFPDIESIHWFSQHSGRRQFMVFEGQEVSSDLSQYGTALYYFNGSGDDITGRVYTRVGTVGRGDLGSRYTQGTPHRRTQSSAWNGLLYLVNGKDFPVVFNGDYAERAGFDSSPATPSGVSTINGHTRITTFGVGRKASSTSAAAAPGMEWAYRYRVSFVNERGQESPLSAPSGLVKGSNHIDECPESQGTANTQFSRASKFVVLNIPRGDERVVARRIYRTKNCVDSEGDLMVTGVAEVFYFCQEIQDNVLTLWEDGHPDAHLGPMVDELDFGPWPHDASLIAAYKNTMFVAGGPESDILYSAPLMPEVFPTDNRLSTGEDAGGEITGLYTTRDALVVFKRRGLYLITGNPLEGFEMKNFTREVGCCAAGSIAEIPGYGLAFLSDDGIYIIVGAGEESGQIGRLEKISTPIPDYIDRINRGAAVQATGFYYPRDKEYWLCVPVDGSQENNFVLVFHTDVGGWSYRENFPIGCAVTTADQRRRLFFGTNDTTSETNKGIHVYDTSLSTKGSLGNVSPLWESIDIDFGSAYKGVNPKYVMVQCLGYGDNDITLDYTVNRQLSAVESAAKGQDQQDVTDRFGVYGTQVWGTTTYWSPMRPVPVRFDISTASKPACRELRVTFAPSSSSPNITLVGYDLGVVGGAPAKRIPINEVLDQWRR
jgi:hypothetical protein